MAALWARTGDRGAGTDAWQRLLPGGRGCPIANPAPTTSPAWRLFPLSGDWGETAPLLIYTRQVSEMYKLGQRSQPPC